MTQPALRTSKLTSSEQTISPIIISFVLWMRKKPYREATVRGAVACVKSISRHANLFDPESVKEYIANASVSDNRKCILLDAMVRFYNFKQIPFQKPVYRKTLRLPFIPLEREVDDLISGTSKKVSTFLQLLKETGLRPGEAWALKWTDLDLERCCLNCTPEKNSNPRQLKISGRIISMLNLMLRQGKWIFHKDEADPLYSLIKFRRTFQRQRRRLAEKLQNPRIQQITFKTLRHYKATMFYHSTKDILATMQLLGHKNIRNTLVYTHLVSFESDDYVCKVAKTIEEAKSLIENGFGFVTSFQDAKLFRKRK